MKEWAFERIYLQRTREVGLNRGLVVNKNKNIVISSTGVPEQARRIGPAYMKEGLGPNSVTRCFREVFKGVYPNDYRRGRGTQ